MLKLNTISLKISSSRSISYYRLKKLKLLKFLILMISLIYHIIKSKWLIVKTLWFLWFKIMTRIIYSLSIFCSAVQLVTLFSFFNSFVSKIISFFQYWYSDLNNVVTSSLIVVIDLLFSQCVFVNFVFFTNFFIISIESTYHVRSVIEIIENAILLRIIKKWTKL